MADASSGQTIVQALVYSRLVARRKWPILMGTFMLTLAFALIITKVPKVDEATGRILIPLSSSVAFGLSLVCVLAKEKLHPAVKTEKELKSLLPKGARVMGLIPRIEVASDARRDRRVAIFACVVCAVLCLALIGFLWEIHLVL
jgi:4-amino-4-deoxy-L-arabinose transferase-like glycosyltransferase